MFKRIFFLPIVFVTLLSTTFGGCSSHQIYQGVKIAAKGGDISAEDVVGAIASSHPTIAQVLKQESVLHDHLVRFIKTIAHTWEKKPKVATNKEYVKYSNGYKSRAIVNFETHLITVETVDKKKMRESLKEAIVHTILTPYDPAQVDLHSDKEVKLGGEPFLYQQVLDQDGKAMRWEWRTNRFAEYIIAKGIKSKTIQSESGSEKVYYVSFAMANNVTNIQTGNIKDYVIANAKRFNVSPALIYAIIDTESSFNPYATSHVPAYGLMQIVPGTAGRDSWRFLYDKDGIPTREYLFNEKNNIEMGTAYYHIVNTKYLGNIKHPLAREYCSIAAYNTGSGNVLRTFNAEREHAVASINKMSPEEVYAKLKHSLPYEETRRYIVKVTEAKKRFLNL